MRTGRSRADLNLCGVHVSAGPVRGRRPGHKRNTELRDLAHTRLSIEDVLLDYLSIFGSDAEFTVEYGGDLSKSRIRVTVPEKPADPFSIHAADSEDDQLPANVLARMGQRPKWPYVRGVNTITYTPAKKSAPDWVRLLTAIVAVIVPGLAVRTLPANVSAVLRQDVVLPLLDTFLSFLIAVAGPMIFFSVVWGTTPSAAYPPSAIQAGAYVSGFC